MKEGEINSAEDLTNPKWRGRIISIEPRSNGGGFIPATVMRLLHGPELLKRIWVDQQPALTRDPRQAVEGVVRGRYAVGIGGGVVLLREFQAQGAGQNVKPLVLPDVAAPVIRGLFLMNRAPHPNAAALFANWFLTREGQTVHASTTTTNSRRKDVAPGDPSVLVAADQRYPVGLDSEDTTDATDETIDYLKRVMG